MSYVSCSFVWKAEANRLTFEFVEKIRWMRSVPNSVRKMSFSCPSKYTRNDFTFCIVPKEVSRVSGVKL